MSFLKKYQKIIIPVALFICVILFILFQSSFLVDNILNIDPYASAYNDEVFYFKQIQSVNYYFTPIGNFGYNESSAGLLGFGSWSMLIAYVYGALTFLIREWTYNIYFVNLIMCGLTFTTVIKIMGIKEKKNYLLLVPLLSLIFTRNTYSGMVESLFYCIVILIFMFLQQKNKKNYTKICAVLIFIATLMRPYYCIFYVLLYFDIKDLLKSCFKICILSLISIGIYFVLTHFFTAEYLSPLLKIDTIISFFEYGIRNGLSQSFHYFISNLDGVIYLVKQSFITGDAVGLIYFLFGVCLLLLIVKTTIKIFVSKKKYQMNLLVIIISLIAFFVIINLYVPYQGSRHVFIFVIFMMLYIANDFDWITFIVLILSILFTNSYFVKDNYNKYPTDNWDVSAYTNDLKKIVVDKNLTDFENTIAFEFGVDNSLYHMLYDINAGIGINLCMSDYLANVDVIESKYIITSINSSNNEVFSIKYDILAKNDWFIIYENNK